MAKSACYAQYNNIKEQATVQHCIPYFWFVYSKDKPIIPQQRVQVYHSSDKGAQEQEAVTGYTHQGALQPRGHVGEVCISVIEMTPFVDLN